MQDSASLMKPTQVLSCHKRSDLHNWNIILLFWKSNIAIFNNRNILLVHTAFKTLSSMSFFHIVTQINITLKIKKTATYKPIFFCHEDTAKSKICFKSQCIETGIPETSGDIERGLFCWNDLDRYHKSNFEARLPSIYHLIAGRIKYLKKSSKILRLPYVIKIDDIYLSTKQIFYRSQASGPEYSVSISQLKIATLDL